MSSLTDLIMSQLGGSLLSNLSGKLDSDENTTKDAIGMALPMLLKGLTNNSSDQDKAQDLFNAVEKDHDGSILENLAGLISGDQASSGFGILKHIFGSKQENVVEQISEKSGLDIGAAGNLLATLAPVVMGFLGKEKKEKNLDVMGLVSLLGNESSKAENSSGLNLGSLFRMLDGNKNGNPLDDMMDAGKGLVGKIFKSKSTGKKTANKKPEKKVVKKAVKKTARPKVKSKTKSAVKPKAKSVVKPKPKPKAKAKATATAKPKVKSAAKSKTAKTKTVKAKAKPKKK